MNELHLLHTLLPELPVDASVPVGPGDDCAVLDVGNGEQLLAAVDQLIGDVHYYTDGTAPEAAGAKLLKRNLSDIAAMGGIPRWALLTLASGGRDDDWLLRFARTVSREAAAYGVLLVGGDLAALPQSCRGEVATLTILGTPGAHQSLLLRRNAVPEEELWVTGALGNSLESGHHLTFQPRLEEGRFLAQHGFSRCALDLSDGLLLDAGRLAEASGVCVEIDATLLPLNHNACPRNALCDGEDYELLFTVPPDRSPALVAAWPAEFASITRIGRILPAENGKKVCDPEGNDWMKQERTGYVHQ